jgi:hypothetical protein
MGAPGFLGLAPMIGVKLDADACVARKFAGGALRLTLQRLQR